MKTTLALSGILLLLVHNISGLTVSFTEVDYRTTESEGALTVKILKNGDNVGTLSFSLTPLTYIEAIDLGISLNDSLGTLSMNGSLPDAAEFEPSLQDFVKSTQNIMFAPSADSESRNVVFSIIDDEIHEPAEGFLIVLKVDDATADPQDLEDLRMPINVTLGRIASSDSISVGFEMRSYTVREDAGEVDNFIFLIKEPSGVQTENLLPVTLRVISTGSSTPADEGVDFRAGNTPRTLVFLLQDQRLAVPLSLIGDNIFEESEDFQFLITIPESAPPGYELGTYDRTDVIILDDDVIILGFEQPEYTVTEGDGSVEVCVRLFELGGIEGVASAFSTTISGTAGDADYTSVVDFFVRLPTQRDGELKVCFDIPITDDDDIEPTEQLTVELTRDSFASENIILQPNVTVVFIQDNDRASANCRDDTLNCDSNAQCLDAPEGPVCTCNPGYTGDGLSCTDINECTNLSHNCNPNAICENTVGSFECICKYGYTGNGIQCTDINECARSTHNCHPQARCQNTAGGFRCICRNGYTGNGTHCYDIDECTRSTHNCHPKARCQNTVGGFRCICRNGYTGNGIQCSDIDECTRSTHNCHPQARCRNTAGRFRCICRNGYTGNGTHCFDINECARSTHNCHPQARCRNTAGRFRCICRNGYTGNGTHCFDINECARSTHNCHSQARCQNTAGGFRCTCRNGYTGNGIQCYDVNECASSENNCNRNALCINTAGGFRCTCKQGFVGNGIICTADSVPGREESSRSGSRSRSDSRSRSRSRSRSGTRSTPRRSKSNTKSQSGTRSRSHKRKG